VLQIAAHEEHFGLDRLLTLCADIAPTLHAMKVGRVIARPFLGDADTGFKRTANRRDFAIAPPSPTLCDDVHAAGHPVHAIGKIGDIFSVRGIDDVARLRFIPNIAGTLIGRALLARDVDLAEALRIAHAPVGKTAEFQ
jgi:phosphopentomutase